MNCGEVDESAIGSTITVAGWVHRRRDHGNLIFIDLRDRSGLLQVVFNPENSEESHEIAGTLRSEWVVQIKGRVISRLPGAENPELSTGLLELAATELMVLNPSLTPPFEVSETTDVDDNTRLKYRFIDLRRPRMQDLLRLRHRVTHMMWDFLTGKDFIHVETPILLKSTPEGAREFLVPSRQSPGKFYALPQSPQQYKQMLMVAGVERYYQLAKCFRDEDLRADRQPEFTQIDVEVSFIDREGMYALMEGLMKQIWKDVLNIDIPAPFPRMTFHDAMNQYGVDKPDTRFELKIQDFSETFKDSDFKVFSGTVGNGGVVKAFNAKGLADITQGEMKALEESAKILGAKGLAFIKAENGEWKSPIVKFFSETEKAALQEKLAIEEGDLILFAADEWLNACEILGKIRLYCAEKLTEMDKMSIAGDQFNFLWVIEFPLLMFDKEMDRWYSSHHPFTSPVPEDVEFLTSEPKRVRGQHYDCVVNGVELGGGSIRIHQPDLQKTVFEDVLKLSPELTQARFGYMLEAFTFGAPPHGGIALGLDRLVAILAGRDSIRDVIAFPKTQKGQDLMSDSPSAATEKQLRDLHVRSVLPEGD